MLRQGLLLWLAQRLNDLGYALLDRASYLNDKALGLDYYDPGFVLPDNPHQAEFSSEGRMWEHYEDMLGGTHTDTLWIMLRAAQTTDEKLRIESELVNRGFEP